GGVKKEVEEYLTRKVAEVLDRRSGRGQAIVTIDVALTSDEIRLTKQEVVPAPGSERQQAAGVLVHRREALQRQTRSAPALRVADAEAAAGREDGQYNSTVETTFHVSRLLPHTPTSPTRIPPLT